MYGYIPAVDCLNVFGQCAGALFVFSQDVGIIDVHGFSYLCFCYFLNSHGLCNTVL